MIRWLLLGLLNATLTPQYTHQYDVVVIGHCAVSQGWIAGEAERCDWLMIDRAMMHHMVLFPTRRPDARLAP